MVYGPINGPKGRSRPNFGFQSHLVRGSDFKLWLVNLVVVVWPTPRVDQNVTQRQPSAAKPFRAPTVAPQDLPVDYSGFIAVVFGVAGVMFRYKLSSWLAIIFSVQSLANMRNMKTDLKQISMAVMFAIMGLVTNYFGPARTAAPK